MVQLLGAEGKLVALTKAAEDFMEVMKRANPQVRTDERDNLLAAFETLKQHTVLAKAFLNRTAS